MVVRSLTRYCISLGFITDYIPFYKSKRQKQQNAEVTFNVIKEADRLYEDNKYVDAYQLLNNEKSTGSEYFTDGEVLWRICRLLFKFGSDATIALEVRGEIINEAYKLISIAHMNKENHAEINKWMGIILDCKSNLEGTSSKIQWSPTVKQYLMRAHELNPEDPYTLYMLGHWCYAMSSLSWLQKKVLSLWYGAIPKSDFSEAYNYFLKCEELKPRFLLSNVYMLGKMCLHLGHNFRARYYLTVATSLKAQNSKEEQYKQEAFKLLKLLDFYNLSKETMFYAF